MNAQAQFTAVNTTRREALATDLEIATSFSARSKGLLGRTGLEPGSGILIDPCPSVHTWFMRFTIDVVFLDGENRVVGLARDLKPFRMAGAWRAVKTIELPAGTIAATETAVGDSVAISEAAGPEANGVGE
jgi:uncharacterized membrane protein (UPF0127 family)